MESSSIIKNDNSEKIKAYIKEGLISKRKHPTANLYIYNYTPKCQYKQKWDEITIMCRGLILDESNKIISRPFGKFFNYDEYIKKYGKIPKESFKVFEKYDGSLGILYFENNKPYIATRGSFTSPQAIKGTKILREKYKNLSFDKNLTYLFEIICPENRIVVDYKDKEDLVLIAVIETNTGKELSIEEFKEFNLAKKHYNIKDLNNIKEEDNKEGYVIKYKSGLRVKIKFKEYLRLHKIITESSSKKIWECLKEDKPIDELLDKVPDEFYNWVKETINKINKEYDKIEKEAKEVFEKNKNIKDRKIFSERIINERTKPILFKMLIKKDYSDIIWKMVKPKKSEKPS